MTDLNAAVETVKQVLGEESKESVRPYYTALFGSAEAGMPMNPQVLQVFGESAAEFATSIICGNPLSPDVTPIRSAFFFAFLLGREVGKAEAEVGSLEKLFEKS